MTLFGLIRNPANSAENGQAILYFGTAFALMPFVFQVVLPLCMKLSVPTFFHLNLVGVTSTTTVNCEPGPSSSTFGGDAYGNGKNTSPCCPGMV